QISILRTWYPDARKTIFHHQFQDVLGILTIVFLFPYATSLDLRRVAHPQLELQLRQQALEPARVPSSFDPHTHVSSFRLPVAVEFLRFPIAVPQRSVTAFPGFGVDPRNVLSTRVIIASNN